MLDPWGNWDTVGPSDDEMLHRLAGKVFDTLVLHEWRRLDLASRYRVLLATLKLNGYVVLDAGPFFNDENAMAIHGQNCRCST